MALTLFPEERRAIEGVAPPPRVPMLPQRAAASQPVAAPVKAWAGEPLPNDYVDVTPGGARNPVQSLFTDPFERAMLQQGNNWDAMQANLGMLDADQFQRNAAAREAQMVRFPTNPHDEAIMEQIAKAPDLGTWAALTFSNPQIIAQKASGMLPGMAASVGGGLAGGIGGAIMGGPVGALIGAGIGGGLGSAQSEFASTILDTAMSDPRVQAGEISLSQAFQDPALMNEARINGAQRGIAVGIMDGVTMAFAGKLGRLVEGALGHTATSRGLGTILEGGMQAAGGAGGEYGAGMLDKGEANLSAMADEAMFELIGSPVETGINAMTQPKPGTEAALVQPISAKERAGLKQPTWQGEKLPDDYFEVPQPVVPPGDVVAPPSTERIEPTFGPKPGPATPEEVANAINVDMVQGPPQQPAPPVTSPDGRGRVTVEVGDKTATYPSPAAPEPAGAPPTPEPVQTPPEQPEAVPEPPEGEIIEEPPEGLEPVAPEPQPEPAPEPAPVPPVAPGETPEEEPETDMFGGATTPPTEPVAPEAPGKLPSPVPLGRGRRDGTYETETTWTPNSEQKLETQFEWVPFSKLKAAEGQDQPRDRAGRPQLAAHVRKIASEFEFDRAYRSPDISSGAPIIDDQGVILQGNGRRGAAELASIDHPEVYAAYKAKAEAHGYDTSGEPGMLVRRVTSEYDRRGIAVQGNVSGSSLMSPGEQSRIDAERIDDDMLDLYDSGNAGGVKAAGNRDFIRRLREKLPESEHNALVKNDGELTPEGERRVENALVAKAFGDKRLADAIAENTDSLRLRKGLVTAAAAWGRMRAKAPNWDFTQDLIAAIELINEAKTKGITWDQIVNQHDVERPLPSPGVVEAGEILLDANRKQFVGGETMAKRLMEYANAGVDAEGGTMDLMGGAPRTPEQVRQELREAAGRKKASDETAPEAKPKAPPKKAPKPEPEPKPEPNYDTNENFTRGQWVTVKFPSKPEPVTGQITSAFPDGEAQMTHTNEGGFSSSRIRPAWVIDYNAKPPSKKKKAPAKKKPKPKKLASGEIDDAMAAGDDGDFDPTDEPDVQNAMPTSPDPTLETHMHSKGAAVSEAVWQYIVDQGWVPGLTVDKAQNLPAGQQMRLMARALKHKYGFSSVNLQSDEEGPIHPARALPQMRDAFRNMQAMAHAHGLPNKAMSLGGRISLSFVGGKQPHWGVYYPGQKSLRIVNRTNTFAHEWGHALDDFLIDHLGKGPVKPKTRNDLSPWSLVNLARRDGLEPTPATMDQAIVVLLQKLYYDHAEAIPQVMQWEAEAQAVNTKGNPTPLAKAAIEKLKRWHSGKKLPRIKGKLELIPASEFYEASESVDPNERYFSTVHELMARSFEAFTATEMGGDKNSDRFISAGMDAFSSTADRQFRLGYPKNGEADAIYAAWRDVMDFFRDQQQFGDQPAEFPDGALNNPTQYDDQVLHSESEPVTKAFIDEAKRASNIAKETMRKTSEVIDKLSSSEDAEALAAELVEKGKLHLGDARKNVKNLVSSATWLLGTTRANVTPRLAKAKAHLERIAGVRDSHAFMEKAWSLIGTMPGQDTLQLPTLERHKNAIIKHVTRKLEGVLKATGRGLELKAADADPIYQRMLGDQNVELTPEQEKIAVEFRRILDDLYRQLQDGGHEFGFVKTGYLPRMLQRALVVANPAKFVAAAKKAYARAFDLEIDEMGHRELVTRVAKLGHRLMDPQGRDQKAYLKDERKAFAEALKALNKAHKAGDEGAITDAQDAYNEAREALIDAFRDDWETQSAEDWRDNILNGKGMTFHQRGIGASQEKARELPAGVEEELADFLETNPLNLVIAYAGQAANTLAFDKTVGNPNGEWRFDQLMGRKKVKKAIRNQPEKYNPATVQGRINIIMELTNPKVDNRYELLLRQALKDNTTTSEDVDMFRQVYANITGLDGKANANNAANKISNFLYAYATLRLLARSVTTALAEPLVIYLRTGNAKAAMATMHSYLGQIARSSQSAQTTREWAASLELIASPLYDTFLHARLGTDGTLGSSQKILSKFMVGNWQTAITNAQLRSVGIGGLVWLRDMGQNVDNATGKRKDYLAGQMAAELRELGIADEKQAGFMKFVTEHQTVPTPDEMATENGQLLKHAIGKLSEQIIQHPTRADKPMAANTPFGKLAFQLTSFLYSFFANVHGATWERAKRNARIAQEVGYTRNEAFGLAGAGAFNSLALGFAGVFMAQLLTTTTREAIYNRDQWDKHKDDRVAWLMSLAWSRTGALGPLDVLKSSIDGIRYERDLTTLVTGPALASILGDVKSIITVGVRNAAGTNTTERNAAKAFYNLVIAPTVAMGLASINTIGPVSEFGRFAAMSYLTSNAAAADFAEMGFPPDEK